MKSFLEVEKLGNLLNGFTQPWFIAGGWAIDIFLGDVTREHKDIEVAILRKDQIRVKQYLSGWEFTKVVNGEFEPWNENEWIELPIHETYCQNNILDSKLEILLNESSKTEWLFRRNLEITRPLSMIGLFSPKGIPFIAPEIALLYKAKYARVKDEHDFRLVHKLLDKERRTWLKQAIALCHPEHHWLREL